MVLSAENTALPDEAALDCYLAGMDVPCRAKAFLLARQLREAGLSCETDLMARSLKAQFKYADKRGARFVAVIGSSELEEGAAEVKDMKNSSSERVKFGELAQYIAKRKGEKENG